VRRWQFKQCRQALQVAPQSLNSVGMAHEPRVAAYFADDAENRDGSELFQQIGIPQQRAFKAGRLARGQVRPDSFKGCGNLVLREPELPENRRHFSGRIRHVVPGRKRRRFFRPMPDEDPEVMHPGRRIQDVVIVGFVFCQPPSEAVQPRLVAELIRRLCLGADIISDRLAVSGLNHAAG